MDDLKRRTVRRRTWLAWAGTIDELRSIGRTVERLYDTARTPDADGCSGDSLSNVDKLMFETTITHGDDSVTGNLNAAISELDRRTATSVTFRIYHRFSDERLRLEMKWLEFFYAVRLVISSPDPGWANQALGSVSEEVDKGRPRWAWTRSIWGRILVYIFSVSMVGVGASLLVEPFVSSLWRTIIANVITFSLGAIFLPERIYSWLFPGVEIIAPGGTSTGSRRFIFVGSIVLTIALGVLVNFITTGAH